MEKSENVKEIEHYKFFQNRECEYFPCHVVKNEDEFNCLFCYCPLYLQEDCMGRPDYILNALGQRIKDCSGCTIVHRPEMYEKVLAHLVRKEDVVSVNIWDLQEATMNRIAEIASFDKMDEEARQLQKNTAATCLERIMESCGESCRVNVLLQPFAAECAKDGYFMFGKERVRCTVLDKIDRQQVTQGYLYAFHAPVLAIEEADSLLEQYYRETFQIACMDVLRDWVQKYLERRHSVKTRQFCSPSFGPGYYGMELEAAEQILGLMNAGRAGITWQDGHMQPMMSLVGIYLISRQDTLPVCKDCVSCRGSRSGCEFCR